MSESATLALMGFTGLAGALKIQPKYTHTSVMRQLCVSDTAFASLNAAKRKSKVFDILQFLERNSLVVERPGRILDATLPSSKPQTSLKRGINSPSTVPPPKRVASVVHSSSHLLEIDTSDATDKDLSKDESQARWVRVDMYLLF